MKATGLIVGLLAVVFMSCSQAQDRSIEARFAKTKESMKRQLADAAIPATRRTKLAAIDAALTRLGTARDLQGTSIPVYAVALPSKGKVALDVSWIADVASVDRLRLAKDGKTIAELAVPDVYLNENKRIATSVVCFDASAYLDDQSAAVLLLKENKDAKWSVELLGPAIDKQTQPRSIALDLNLLYDLETTPPPSK